MAALKILIIPGSNRTGSYNARLAGAFARECAMQTERTDIDITRISLADFALPLYDADDEASQGIPSAAINLKRLMALHQGVFIASPEYNSSVSPLVKNTIDWLTRIEERDESMGHVFRTRVFAIGAASNGHFGGMRGLMALRSILELGCKAHVVAQQVAIAYAHRAFDATDHLVEERDSAQLRATVRQLIEHAERFAS